MKIEHFLVVIFIFGIGAIIHALLMYTTQQKSKVELPHVKVKMNPWNKHTLL